MKMHNEDYNKEWGFIDYNGKAVLDCGADYGSTAKFFLERGAKKVIAVEYDDQYWGALIALSKVANVVPVQRFLSKSKDFELLLDEYEVDVAKVDVEGGEIGLLGVDCEHLRRAAEFTIEYHPGEGYPITVNHNYSEKELSLLLTRKFESCGFIVKGKLKRTLYANRIDDH